MLLYWSLSLLHALFLVLPGLGDFFDEACLFSVKPKKLCLCISQNLQVTSGPIYLLFISMRRAVLRLDVLVLRPYTFHRVKGNPTVCSWSSKCQRCGTAASFHERSQPSGSSWVITFVIFTGQCKSLEFMVKIQPVFQDQQFHLKEPSELRSELEKLQFGDCLLLWTEYVEFLFSTISIFIFPLCVLPCPQQRWCVPPSSKHGKGSVPVQFMDALCICGTLKVGEVLKKRKRRMVPVSVPSLLLLHAPSPLVLCTVKFRFMKQ